jgi:hypothetical protein
METVSENSRGRGRPRKYELHDSLAPDLKEYWRHANNPVRGILEKPGHTARQQQNIILAERVSDYLRHYYESGEGLLSTDSDGVPDETTERYDLASYMTKMSHEVPQRVMTELGRLLPDDEEALWRALLWYWNYPWRLRAQDAARIIRELRLGQRVALPDE